MCGLCCSKQHKAAAHIWVDCVVNNMKLLFTYGQTAAIIECNFVGFMIFFLSFDVVIRLGK